MSLKIKFKDEASPDASGVISISKKGLSKAYRPQPLSIIDYQQKLEKDVNKDRKKNGKAPFKVDPTTAG